MDIEVPKRRSVAPGRLRLAMASSLRDEARMRVLRDVLTDLQDQARDVFATSGETVDRFLRERRDEAQREAGPSS